MTEMPWWQSAVIYQIYPRSFQDTDGDGVGDLRGIIQRLPHLVELGIHAIWIAPVFRSPMADFGYDVSDYIDIDPLFGSMNDFDELLVAAHRSGLKVLLDLVPNHTSDQHPWFLESRSAAGICGTIPGPTAVRLTIGCRNSEGVPGSSIPRPVSTTIMRSSPDNPTSTGVTRRCAARSTTSCGSGSGVASTVFASTCCGT